MSPTVRLTSGEDIDADEASLDPSGWLVVIVDGEMRFYPPHRVKFVKEAEGDTQHR